MANLIDDLQQGLVSRRKLLDLLTGAAGSVVLASAQSKQTKAPEGIVEPPKLSPANIGGGGRIERDFYREWLKKSKVPMLEGYSLPDAAKQEGQPWPEIGGGGPGLYFFGEEPTGGGIFENFPGQGPGPPGGFFPT